MAKERSLVRASDIGSWAYCRRAWWLAVVKGAPHRRPERLHAGNRAHRQHGATVAGAAQRARWGWIMIAGGVLGLLLYLLSQIF
jgi:hypothetical protein